MNELIVRLRFLIPTLPRAERAVAQALLEKPELICFMTLAELARETDSSDASVIRFCRKMGYSGFTDMKQAFAHALNDSSITIVEEICREDSVLDNLHKVYKSNMQSFLLTPTSTKRRFRRFLKQNPFTFLAQATQPRFASFFISSFIGWAYPVRLSRTRLCS